MKKIGLGIIGLGYIGKTHLRHCLKLHNAEPIWVSDLSRKNLETAKNAGVKKTFTDYEQLLREPAIDAVIIALPTHLHLQCAKDAAEAKKHIFVEKPMATNPADAREIISAVQKNSVKLMVGYPLRFDTKFHDIKERIESGTLGDIEIAHAIHIGSGPFFHRAESHIPTPVPEWWFNRKLTGGGALIDTGIHIINLLRWYFGEITNIRSILGYRFNLDLEDSATCLAKFESGTRAVINAGWFSQEFRLEVELLGSVSHINVGIRPPNRLFAAVQMLTTGTSKFYQSHFAELQYFVERLIDDASPSPSGQDGLQDLEAISLAYNNQIRLD